MATVPMNIECVSADLCLTCPCLELEVDQRTFDGYDTSDNLFVNRIKCKNYGPFCSRMVKRIERKLIMQSFVHNFAEGDTNNEPEDQNQSTP